jgi:glycerol-3-phosphate cytidylyltransferase
VRILGVEYKEKSYTGRDLPISVYYNTRDHGYSTTELRERVYQAEKAKRGARD